MENTTGTSLLRRLAAIAYDSLLLGAVLVLASFLYVGIAGGAPRHWPARLGLQIYLLAVAFLFFGWFWTHGGQTLGMRSWRLKLVSRTGGRVSWRQAAVRFAAALLSWACLGLGFLWVLFDRERLAWHDRVSGTRLVLLPKPRRSGSGAAPEQVQREAEEQQHRQ